MRERAFTLIELLVVISVIGLLSSIVLVALSGQDEKARFANAQQFASQVSHTLGAYAVAVWTLNEGMMNSCSDGKDACDSSGYGNHATTQGGMTNEDWVEGAFGQALEFDGTDDYLQVDGFDLLDGATEATVSFWLWIDPSVSAAMDYIGKYQNSGTDNVFVIDDSVGDRGIRATWYNEADANVAADYTTALFTEEWHHIVSTFDGSTGTAEIFVDGSLVQTAANASVDSLASDANQPLLVGGNVVSRWLNGRMDDVRIFTATLSLAQVRQLYGRGPSPSVVLRTESKE